MKQDKFKTNVKFLVGETDDFEDVYAYFPDLPYNEHFNMSYAHIGQHGACCPIYAKESRDATKKERKDLQIELETKVGYNLNVLN